MKFFFLYFLRDPINPMKGYVGATNTLKRRYSQHLRTKEACYRGCWIRALKKQGLRPEVEMLAQVPESEWPQWEVDYIAAFRSLGYVLVNGTLGGDGGSPRLGMKNTPECNEKIRQAHLGQKKPWASEQALKMSAAHVGLKYPKEHCERQGAARFGKKKPSNTSGFVGVDWHKHHKLWRSRFSISRKAITVGYFEKIEDAVFARALAVALQ